MAKVFRVVDCLYWKEGKCSKELYGGRPSYGVCLQCPIYLKEQAQRGKRPESLVSLSTKNDFLEKYKPISHDQWSWVVRIIERLRIESDKGVGDTLERLIKPLGGDTFKRWYMKIMKEDCGCNIRKTHLNLKFPYKNVL
jgi:hypothetical protein